MTSFSNKLGDKISDFYIYGLPEQTGEEGKLSSSNGALSKNGKNYDPSRVFVVNPKEYNPLNVLIGRIFLVVGAALMIAGIGIVLSKATALHTIGYTLLSAGYSVFLIGGRIDARQKLAKLANPGELRALNPDERRALFFAIIERIFENGLRSITEMVYKKYNSRQPQSASS